MKCPIDNVDLQMTERSGIEIDYCPTCRGVWLDRGELDKIIERSESARPAEPQQPARPSYPLESQGHGGRHGYKKRKSMLGELFDF
jgi:uncharacterized protein